ncbi:TPA: multidrug transporter subunit MdtI [Cronobacter sakazakii]|nr:multidrug transporter subunit MdtI [Cronobacter sakazakii]
MSQVELQHILWLLLAIGLEIIANIWLKFSDGFRRPVYGVASLAAVLAAFSALWGGFGIAATVAAGWIMFGQRLNRKGWAGLGLLLVGMVIIKLA